ncbi:unnamed protein product [Rotaria magnacalcarata]|uniref:Uncharacterized protein n=1 Tax=Rotaria magnacalcarata TaxID=392030 RepID=A0A819CGF8_9BILA|nr:unnamed protein product [Rotaria magnacalcarata]
MSIAFTAYTSAGYGRPAVIVLIALFFFESVMFPTIFVMDTANLDRRTAGFLIMEVSRDAVFPSINYGFSCAESTNFALEHWIEYAKFDEQKQFSMSRQYSGPLIRAALSRSQFELNKSQKKNCNKLLCLTASLVSNLSTFSFNIFKYLKQTGKYRENILNGLWNYHLLNIKPEQTFNQWLCKQSLLIVQVLLFFN